MDSEESRKKSPLMSKRAVKNPGVYQLQAGARVHDALQKSRWFAQMPSQNPSTKLKN